MGDLLKNTILAAINALVKQNESQISLLEALKKAIDGHHNNTVMVGAPLWGTSVLEHLADEIKEERQAELKPSERDRVKSISKLFPTVEPFPICFHCTDKDCMVSGFKECNFMNECQLHECQDCNFRDICNDGS